MGETIAAGGLDFHVENRIAGAGQDGGLTLRVCGTADGQGVELLRFDMFHIQPHYHYAPTGKNLRYDLDPLTLGDGVGWTMSQLRTKLPELVAKAGYEAMLTPEGAKEAESAMPEIERRWRAQR